MTTLVRSRPIHRLPSSEEQGPKKKAKVKRVVTTYQPTLSTDTVYRLSTFAFQTLTPPVGSLIQLSKILGEGAEASTLTTQYLIYKKISLLISKIDGTINDNIKISALDHTAEDLAKFLQDEQIASPTVLLNIDIKENGKPSHNANITYEITIIATDYFQRLKTAEASISPFLPLALSHLVQEYIS